MAITHNAGISFSANNGTPTSFTVTQSADGEVNLDVTIAPAASNFAVVCPIDASQVKSILMYSDAAMTVVTKNGATTVDTFTLSANKPLFWQFGMPINSPITGDCTALAVTSTPGGTLKLFVLEDV